MIFYGFFLSDCSIFIVFERCMNLLYFVDNDVDIY